MFFFFLAGGVPFFSSQSTCARPCITSILVFRSLHFHAPVKVFFHCPAAIHTPTSIKIFPLSWRAFAPHLSRLCAPPVAYIFQSFFFPLTQPSSLFDMLIAILTMKLVSRLHSAGVDPFALVPQSELQIDVVLQRNSDLLDLVSKNNHHHTS